MKPDVIYISQVLSKLPAGPMRTQIEMELRSHIADRIERGHTVEEAIRQLGDPTALAESYLSAVPLVPAPHLRRLAAKFVDVSIPLAYVVAVAATVVLGMPERVQRGPLGDPIAMLAALSVLLVGVLYGLFLALSESRTGQTPGKRLFGLRVVSESGTRISLGRAFVRQLPILFQFVWVDALFALFTDRRQRAFEMLTKTRVVDARDPRQGERVSPGVPHPVAL